MKGTLFRDRVTGLPIKFHPTIKDMFPSEQNPYYHCGALAKKVGQSGAKFLKQLGQLVQIYQ